MYDILIRDQSGQFHCKFFRVPYKGYFERFQSGQIVRVIGKVIDYRGRMEFHHPELKDFEAEEEVKDDLIPIYTEIENLGSAKMLRIVRSAIEQMSEAAWGPEKFPQSLMQENDLIGRKEALIDLHFPDSKRAQDYFDLKSAAHRRLIFEEFFWLEIFLAAKKAGLKKEVGLAMQPSKSFLQTIQKSLPFQMTGAQVRTLQEIEKDLLRAQPMYRLVQGDVGSGKTLVALMAAALVSESGHQTCLMVPTEILAEQHFTNAKKILEPLGITVELLTGKMKTSEKREVLERLQGGKIGLVIGTHALIEDEVLFKSLALVVIDEQHRFGVEQRGKLKRKGVSPHFLIMTATPIPRTLAMTVYGDLDVSVIDEMPPGRSPIQTRVVFENKKAQALDFMREQIKKGRQAYIVYPLVEESEKIDLKNAVEEAEKLKAQFPDLRIGLLHGKMKSLEKDQIMTQFRNHELDILVSTTVIEVGVDVPNANLMIIEHAERFGLSQLHQLRGRVGRGVHKSFCILLMGYAVSEEAKARTAMMEQSSDGFKIAEFDLEMRGPGEFMGTRQSGLAGFKLANLVRDVQILSQARSAAFETLRRDPTLTKPENKFLKEELLKTHGPAALASIA
jgi:ATP-dependent DNA helicase RecG